MKELIEDGKIIFNPSLKIVERHEQRFFGGYYFYKGQIDENNNKCGIGREIQKGKGFNDGCWHNDRLNGYGRIIYNYNESREGQFENSTLMEGIIMYPDGRVEHV